MGVGVRDRNSIPTNRLGVKVSYLTISAVRGNSRRVGGGKVGPPVIAAYSLLDSTRLRGSTGRKLRHSAHSYTYVLLARRRVGVNYTSGLY